MKTIRVDVNSLISPHFDKVLYSNALNKVLNGGRGSTKSTVISLQLVMDFLSDPQANVLVLRKVAKDIELSVYEQIKWAIDALHATDLFIYKKSPYRIIHKATGTAFYFSGVDDPSKLKGMIIANGYVRWLWFEELAEFKSWQEIDTVRLSFTRKKLPPGKHVVCYYSYNPPNNPYDWINEWIQTVDGQKNWYVDHSSYKDVMPGILSQDYLDEIEVVKKNDPNYYRWNYLGEVVGLGTNVYNMDLFKLVDKVPDDDYITNLLFGMDVGYETSATTVVAAGLSIKGILYVLDTWYYSPAGRVNKMAPSQLDKAIYPFLLKVAKQYQVSPTKLTMDSADGALHQQFILDYNIRWHKVNKNEYKNVGMIELVRSLAAQDRIRVVNIESNQIFLEQHKMYRWDENTLDSDDPKVIKKDDHTPDAFKYLVSDNARLLNLKH